MLKCKVCFEERKKLNKHGSCRCCRVFFYRARTGDQSSKTFKCLQDPKYCQMGLGKFCCKQCRFERCLEAKMRILPSNDKVITNGNSNENKVVTNEDFNVDLDTLLQEGTPNTAILVDDEMERFFDDIYKENFQEYFQQLLLNNENLSMFVPCRLS